MSVTFEKCRCGHSRQAHGRRVLFEGWYPMIALSCRECACGLYQFAFTCEFGREDGKCVYGDKPLEAGP